MLLRQVLRTLTLGLDKGEELFKPEAEKPKPYYIPFNLLLVILPLSR